MLAFRVFGHFMGIVAALLLASAGALAQPVFKMAIAGIERIDGYQMVLKARALQGDAAIDFAAQQILLGYPKNATK